MPQKQFLYRASRNRLTEQTPHRFSGGTLLEHIARAVCHAGGYNIFTQTIPGDITPKNRLLLAEPAVPPG